MSTAIEVPLGSRTTPEGYVGVQEPMVTAGEDPTRPWFQLRVQLDRGGESPILKTITLVEYCMP